MGIAGDEDQAGALVHYLLDPDPFTRLCAWRSLRQLTGQNFFADWLYGERTAHARAAEQYFAWISRDR